MAKFLANGNGEADLPEELSNQLQTLQEQLSLPVALRATTLGFSAGLRSMTPFAVLGWTRKQNPAPTNSLEELLDTPALSVLTSMLASGELIGDKLPNTPSRIQTVPLLGRVALGGLAGLSIFRRYQQPLVVGAVLGALGAGAGAYAGYYVRRALTDSTKTPSWLLGLAEDGLAFGLGLLAVKKN